MKEDSKKVVSSVENVPLKTSRARSIIVKILCVLGALFTWLYVMSNDSPNYDRTFNSVPVSIVGASDLENNTGMTIMSGQGHVVDVTVTGIKSDVVSLSVEDIVAYVDVSSLKKADKYGLNVKVDLPKGSATVTSVSPNNVTVSVDKTSSVSVRVVPKLTTYNLSMDYVLGTLVPENETITVSGPITVLDTIDRAEVSVGDLGQLTGTVTASGMINLCDASGNKVSSQFIKLSQDSMKVTVPVYEYKNIPVTVSYKYGYYNDRNVTVTTSPQTIRIKGDVETLKGIDDYIIEVDEKKITDDRTITEAVSLPAGIENVDMTESVEVKIIHKNTKTRRVVLSNFKINNPNGIDCELVNETLTVEFRGLSEQLALLSDETVILVADAENILKSPGTVTVPVIVKINVESISGNQVYELGEYRVELKVS
ncbi:MAG: hypothetical protein J5933_06780 [Clostridia bacterium]|nr:hypothetical protein [Clostridia bacterium]